MKCIFKMWILDLEILDVIFLILVLQGVTHIAHWCDEVSFLTVSLKGNPLCWNSNLSRFCESETEDKNYSQNSTNTTSVCPAQACPPPYEYSPTSPIPCFCALPLFVGYRLKSPGFSDFRPYRYEFEVFLTSRLELSLYQLYIDSFTWEQGPRLGMHVKFFPENNTRVFNRSEIQRIFDIFTSWKIHNPDMFGPYEFISFSLLGFHKDGLSQNPYLIYFCDKAFLMWELMLIYQLKNLELSSLIHLTYTMKSSILKRQY